MKQIPYINCAELNEFYTVQQLANLLSLPKQELKEKCERYGIKLRQNEIGDYGFVRYDVRKIIQSGELAAVKVGRKYRIPLTRIMEYIENNCI